MRLVIVCYITMFGFTFVSCGQSLSQTASFPLVFNQLPLSDPDLNRPGAGAEQWNDQNTVNIPDALYNSPRLDAYYRFSYTDIASFSGPAETYDFSQFDKKINDAIIHKQKFS